MIYFCYVYFDPIQFYFFSRMSHPSSTKLDALIYNVPEIDKGRKLADYIANSLQKKGIQCNSNNVDLVLEKLNLKNRELSKGDLQRVTTVLIRLNEKKNTIRNRVDADFIEERVLPTTIAPQQTQPEEIVGEEVGMLEKDTKLVSNVLIVDSKDRNTDRWTLPNPFGMLFGYPSKTGQQDNDQYKGYIEKIINNVYSIELLEAILPARTQGGDNLMNYPYLLLDVEEFGTHFLGSNRHLNKCFAKLSSFTQSGNFVYYRPTDSDEECNKQVFSPRITLNKMSFVLRTPDGAILNIQPFMDENKKKKSNVIYTFRIKSYQRTLETVYIY